MVRLRSALTRWGWVALVVALGANAGCAPHDDDPAATGAALPAGVDTLRTITDEPAVAVPLTVGERVVTEGVNLRRYAISYPSGDLTITGLLALPDGDGPHPALVVLHGYERTSYDPERSMTQFEEALVAAGYVVLHPDLRNYGGSGDDPEAWEDLEVGATRDAVAALRALAGAGLPSVDPARIGLVGLSQGGRIALCATAVAPDLVQATVAMSPMSSDAWDNVGRFDASLVDPVAGYLDRGTPQTQPAYWADVNPTTFVGPATPPVLVVQGDADVVVDPAWSDATVAAWQAAGGDATLAVVPGADHVYSAHLAPAMALVIAFLDEHLAPASA